MQCLVIERHFTDIQYGQPADNRGPFVQFVIDILMMMTDDDDEYDGNASPDITFYSWVENDYGNCHDLTVLVLAHPPPPPLM